MAKYNEYARDNEPRELDNDLEERLLSARNTIDLGLLAFREDEHGLIATAIEDAFYKLQILMDDYCVIDEETLDQWEVENGSKPEC